MEPRLLTESEKQEIAEMAADRAYQRFYAVVGESVEKKILRILGAGGIAQYDYFNGDVPKP